MSEINNTWRGWQQGHLVESYATSQMLDDVKDYANDKEKYLVRPTPTGNAICRTFEHEDAEWIAQRLNTAAILEDKEIEYQNKIKELEDKVDELEEFIADWQSDYYE